MQLMNWFTFVVNLLIGLMMAEQRKLEKNWRGAHEVVGGLSEIHGRLRCIRLLRQVTGSVMADSAMNSAL